LLLARRRYKHELHRPFCFLGGRMYWALRG
jgi:hypothetical protein